MSLSNLDAFPLAPEGGSEKFGAEVSSFGADIGLTGLGAMQVTVQPGKRAFPFHNHLGNDEAALQQIGGMNSFGRLIDPGEIAELIHWVHHNPVINGAVLHANLGQKEA